MGVSHGRYGTTGGPSPARTGETVDFIDPVGTHPARFHAGDGVPVLYDPASPDHARIRGSDAPWWLAPISWGALGLLLAIPMVFSLIGQVRSAAARQ